MEEEGPIDPTGELPKKLPKFNQSPQWLLATLQAAGSFVERWGWFLLLGALFLLWLVPWIQQWWSELQDARRHRANEGAERERVSKLEEQRRKHVEAQQRQLAMDGKEWQQHKQALEEEKRRQRIRELDDKSKRLGLRPRGSPHYARDGSDARHDAELDDLYQ